MRFQALIIYFSILQKNMKLMNFMSRKSLWINKNKYILNRIIKLEIF